MENVMNLLLEHFVIHSTSIAFPELTFPICLRVSVCSKFSREIPQLNGIIL